MSELYRNMGRQGAASEIQYGALYDAHAPIKTGWSECHRLLVSLLENAVLVLDRYQRGPDRIRLRKMGEEALEWFTSDVLQPFSFRFCCQHLQIDPPAFRELLWDHYAAGTLKEWRTGWTHETINHPKGTATREEQRA